MKRYIHASEDSGLFALLKSFNLDQEVKELGSIFDEEFASEYDPDEIKDAKLDFVAQHIYEMLKDISFDDVFYFVDKMI